MECNCDCHKRQNASDLQKCREAGKKKDKKIKELEKKFLVLTITIAIVGTIIGKEFVDKLLELFETTERIQNVITLDQTPDYTIPYPPVYGGISPSPSTLAVFGLFALMPRRRRR